MNQFHFEKLDVYQKSLDFVSKIYDHFETLSYRHQKAIGNNLLRAAFSIISNISEGCGRRGRGDKRRFFEISQASAFECIPSLTILHKKHMITKNHYEELYYDCYDICKMISGLIKRFK